MDALLAAWTASLPAVLKLLDGPRRDLFRREIQRFLAFHAMRQPDAEALAERLAALLTESLRAADQQDAASLMTAFDPTLPAMAKLGNHLLAQWLDACAAAEGAARNRADLDGDVFFGPRLGGPGRPGAIRRDRPDG
jgi:hypothetical protein